MSEGRPDPIQVSILSALTKSLERRFSEPVEMVAGAISDVFLVATLAYKLKRPIRSKYVHYHSTELRHQFCLDEVRLNRKFWPELYRRVLPVAITSEGVEVDGSGPVVDWVVEMNRFAQTELLPRRPEGLSEPHFVMFGSSLGSVHARSDVIVSTADPVATTWEWMSECLDMVNENDPDLAKIVRAGYSATEAALTRCAPLIRRRAADGWTREIHGDLHPGNMVFHDGVIRAFDCLEYSDALRQLDVLVDVGAAATGVEDLYGNVCGRAFVRGWRELFPAAFDEHILSLYRAGRRLVDAKVASIMRLSTEHIRARLIHALAELREVLDG